MANNSAKKNEKGTRSIRTLLKWAVVILLGWQLGWNSFFLLGETISLWHYLLCCLVCGSTYLCYKQIIKCWELGLPQEAAEYYYDILALNGFVHLLDPLTHLIWHIYWLIVVFIVYHGLRWLWDYITPKYQPVEEQETEEGGKKKEKKEKQKIKYMKH